jgi:hypothetical protein
MHQGLRTRITGYLGLAALFLAAPASLTHAQLAQDPTLEAHTEAFTQQVIVQSSAYHEADPSHRDAVMSRLMESAQYRQSHMLQLFERNPAKFLSLALPSKLRAALPESVQPLVEQEVEADGTVHIFHEDYKTSGQYRYYLKTATEQLTIQFAGHVPEMRTGSRLKVKGIRLNQVMAIQSQPSNVQVSALSAPVVSGGQKTLVILVNFKDNPAQPYTQAQARQTVFTSVSNFHLENSYQQAWLTGDVAGWYTIPLSSKVCDYSTLATQANAAASAAGVNISGYSRFVYAFPQNACQWWGLGTIGGNPSGAWINGSLQLQVVGHEMGHNFGLYHSHSLQCGAVTLAASCPYDEYGDTLDAMGQWQPGHYNAFQKERLGWVNSSGTPPVTTAQAGGQFLIDAYETSSPNPHALKVLKSKDPTTGLRTYYYVEYRQSRGADSFLTGNTNVLNGVVVHLGTESSPDTSFLLDMTPVNNSSSSWMAPALDVAKSYQDPFTGIGLSVAWVTDTTAAVNISLPTSACTRAVPTVAVTPATGVVAQAGSVGTFTLSVTNQDSAGCSAATFAVTAAPPGGWTDSIANPSLTITPGATASTTITVTSPKAAANGSYSLPLTVKNGSDTSKVATATAKYIVGTVCSHSNPTVTISAQSTAVKAGTQVSYTVTILNNDSSSCAASTFTMSGTAPGGFQGSISPGSLSVAPAAKGTVTVKLASATNAAKGTYSFSITATNSAATTYKGTGTGSYKVGP